MIIYFCFHARHAYPSLGIIILCNNCLYYTGMWCLLMSWTILPCIHVVHFAFTFQSWGFSFKRPNERKQLKKKFEMVPYGSNRTDLHCSGCTKSWLQRRFHKRGLRGGFSAVTLNSCRLVEGFSAHTLCTFFTFRGCICRIWLWAHAFLCNARLQI